MKVVKPAEIILVLDRSASMREMQQHIISGFNKFILEQKEYSLSTNITFSIFNRVNNILLNRVSLSEIRNNFLSIDNYRPCGSTSLFDSVAATIKEVNNTFDHDPYKKALVILITDGEDNSSETYKRQQIQDLVKFYKNTFNWHFILASTNQAMKKISEELGFNNSVISNLDQNNIEKMFSSISKEVLKYRNT